MRVLRLLTSILLVGSFASCVGGPGLGAAPAGDHARSGPVDPDLKLGASCRGHLEADRRAAMLPREIRETIVLWPRAGKRTVDGDCQSVTRFTLVNHTGQIVTISFVELPEGAVLPADGWELVVDDGPSRARFRATQTALGSAGEPTGRVWFLESESGPTTSQETLESILSFFDPAAVARAVLTGVAP
jgi:hypothetical protein